ncbi:hypothetical protein CLF_100099 [Clonorchis sinensis]|uniref:Uncharacterized protein n=1 Tax=Clonorchis sinensis TaxID=79923 RepID=G7Y2N4_CLOSI|nr:hypothetical protein CLF_100099 [Clonorchis sinensis]
MVYKNDMLFNGVFNASAVLFCQEAEWGVTLRLLFAQRCSPILRTCTRAPLFLLTTTSKYNWHVITVFSIPAHICKVRLYLQGNINDGSPPGGDILFPKLFNPEAASLQAQWKEIIENARYWLLHSCSSEALRQQLQVLHEKILDIAGSVRHLSNRMPRQDADNRKSESEDLWTSEHASIQNMIQVTKYIDKLFV